MRKFLWCVVAASVLACTDGSPTQNNGLTLPPLHLTLAATSRVITMSGGTRVLEVSAMLKNETATTMSVATEPACPLVVVIQPDPTGQPQLSTAASMFCQDTGAEMAIAPGDSTVLTRVIGADSLATYGAGTFGVGALVSTSTSLIGAFAGAVQLPLSDTP